MKKIGVLFGMENTFPGALVERINSMAIDGISAEFVQVGGVVMAEPCPYAVIVDRISHDMPFYRAYLKNAVLTGTQVINNPFWWSADDKFFNYAPGCEAGSGRAEDGAAAAQVFSAGYQCAVGKEFGISAEVAGDL